MRGESEQGVNIFHVLDEFDGEFDGSLEALDVGLALPSDVKGGSVID